jgi:sirohydrochlorin ferrochelatase
VIKMKKGLLIIDRGSRESEVKDELKLICERIENCGGYDFASYCFLEVIPPYIEEGIRICLSKNVDSITVMPYFLYPGMKLKESVKQCAQLCHRMKIRVCIAKPLSYHSILHCIVLERINELKCKMNVAVPNKNCDILVIGHGSSDGGARTAFRHTMNNLIPFYKSVNFCFLELDTPNIYEGVEKTVKLGTGFLIAVPYFLHKGVHVKKDIITELRAALEKFGRKDIFMTDHLGAGSQIIEAILDRAREAESRIVSY